MNQNKLFLLFVSALSCANQFYIKPKVGAQVSQLHLGTIHPQKQPVFELENAVYYFDYANTKAANSFLFNASGTRGSISKNNIDGAFITQYMAGLQFGLTNEAERPSYHYSFAPVLSVYALIDDSKEHSIQADRFIISPLTTGGFDLGLEIAKNGSYLQLGVGGHVYRCNYRTGDLFAAMAQVKSTSVSSADIDTLPLIKADNTSYKASVDPFILPYAYTEVNTEIGDMLSIFLKFNYGFVATPSFKNADPTIEMFSKDPTSYAANSIWHMHSASAGLKIRMEDLF